VKRLCIRGDKFIVKVREESSALDTTQEITRRGLEKTYSNRDAEISGLIIAAVANPFLREALSSSENDTPISEFSIFNFGTFRNSGLLRHLEMIFTEVIESL